MYKDSFFVTPTPTFVITFFSTIVILTCVKQYLIMALICISLVNNVEDLSQPNLLFYLIHSFLCVCACSVAQSCLTPCHAMDRNPLGSPCMGFSRQKYWSGLLFPSAGFFLIQGSNPCLLCLLHWQGDSLPLRHLESPSPSPVFFRLSISFRKQFTDFLLFCLLPCQWRKTVWHQLSP